MKECPFCGEIIQNKAKKCRFCHARLNGDRVNYSVKSRLKDDDGMKLLNLEHKLLIAACIMLGIAIIWFGGYEFYTLNRIVIFIFMLILLIKNYRYRQINEKKIWVYGIAAFVYNPIFSIYLTRPIRTVIDIVLIIIFIKIIKQNKITHEKI